MKHIKTFELDKSTKLYLLKKDLKYFLVDKEINLYLKIEYMKRKMIYHFIYKKI